MPNNTRPLRRLNTQHEVQALKQILQEGYLPCAVAVWGTLQRAEERPENVIVLTSLTGDLNGHANGSGTDTPWAIATMSAGGKQMRLWFNFEQQLPARRSSTGSNHLVKLTTAQADHVNEVIHQIMSECLRDQEMLMFGSLHHGLCPYVRALYPKATESPCVKYICPGSAFRTESSQRLPHGFTFDQLKDSDLELAASTSKIARTKEYLYTTLDASLCIRDQGTGDMVCWALVHQDSSFGTLYTIPSFRRRRFAQMLMSELSRRTFKRWKASPATSTTDDLFIHIDIVADNAESMAFFDHLGSWQPLYDNAWVRVYPS